MPFLDDADTQVTLSKAIGQDDLGAADDATFRDGLRAAYRMENTVGSFLAKDGDLPDNVVTNPDYNPYDTLTEEEKLDERFLSNILTADNQDEVEAVRRQRDREIKDRAILEQTGFVPTMIAAIADPINMIPVGGTAYKTYRGGSSVLQAGMVTAGAGAISATATEAGLHYSQIQRTYGESAVNVTAASLLGGILGASPVAVREMLGNAGHKPDEALADIERSLNPEAPDASTLSVGAAKVYDDIRVKGKVAEKATEVFGFDPLSRTITSAEKETRVVSSRLVENPIEMDRPLSQAVETKAKTKIDGMMFQALEEHLNIYEKGYRKAGGKMSRRDFGEEVGKAVRNGSDDPYVQKVADIYNSKIYEPVKKWAIEAGLLPKDVDVATAKNYLNRVWNKQKLIANAAKFNDVVSRWLMQRQPDLEIEDAKSLAGEIFGRIISTPDGRLEYDYKISENISKSSKGSGLAGTFKARSFDIPDDMVEDFLENDIEVLSQIYLRKTVPDIEIVKEFGDVNMQAEMKAIEQAYVKKIEANPKQAEKLNKQKEADIEDLAAMRDRIRNRYNIADHSNPWVRAARVARDWNYMRLLGGVVAASVPDVARIVMAEGMVKTFGTAFKALGNLNAFKMSAREAKMAGVGTDALMGGRAEILADVADYAQGGTAFERGVRSSASKFSSINLMNYWTAGMKQFHAVTAQTRIADDLAKGKYDKRLGQMGISEPDAKNLAQQFEKYGKKMDGVFVANTKDWDNPALVEMWRNAMRKESDRVIIVPGQEKPLFMSTEMGKTIFQFKTFMFSATQRIMISSLQAQDKHMFQGLTMMFSLGAMSYAFKQWDAGREVTTDPKALVMEGIDRSGALGILMEFNNTLEKVSANSYGLRPLVGVNAPASRYASRTALDSMVGPTFGLAGDAIKVMGAATNEYEWTDSDIRAIRRLIPGQNLSFLRQGFDALEKEVLQ